MDNSTQLPTSSSGALQGQEESSPELNCASSTGEQPINEDDDQSSTPALAHDDEVQHREDTSEAELESSLLDVPSVSTSLSPSESPSYDKKQEYERCKKLFAEDKINGSNAWDLNMVDCMEHILSAALLPNDSMWYEAAESMDVCAKIYEERINSLFADTLEFANSLAGCSTQRDQDAGIDDNSETICSSLTDFNIIEDYSPGQEELQLSSHVEEADPIPEPDGSIDRSAATGGGDHLDPSNDQDPEVVGNERSPSSFQPGKRARTSNEEELETTFSHTPSSTKKPRLD